MSRDTELRILTLVGFQNGNPKTQRSLILMPEVFYCHNDSLEIAADKFASQQRSQMRFVITAA
jgi:hypothetical protein